ncbi:MAG: (2Fe-2S)-binding protein [Chloroflexi bacterium]|nr:(2Fe-2S)-binding protein [Chloroflexota bacterium]
MGVETDVVDIILNGKAVQAQSGTTILQAAAANGVAIPTLCFHRDLSPTGACRMCVVEVARSRTLVASCHTLVTHGMVIETHSAKVLRARKVIMELMMASHPDFCLVCDKANICEMRALSAELGVGVPRFRAKKRFYQIEENPYVIRDLSKCVLCYRCVKACKEVKGANLFSMARRGFEMKVVVDDDAALDKEVCRDCGICISHCPVGALVWRPDRFRKPTDSARTSCRPLVIKG